MSSSRPQPLPAWLRARASPPLPASLRPQDDSAGSNPCVWLILYATTNFGQALTKICLARGDRVVAVGWTLDLSSSQMQHFANSLALQVVASGIEFDVEDRVFGISCEPRVRKSVDQMVKEAILRWGRIDAVILGFSYALMSSCEDSNDDDVRAEIETNIYSNINTISATLPFFRNRAINHLSSTRQRPPALTNDPEGAVHIFDTAQDEYSAFSDHELSVFQSDEHDSPPVSGTDDPEPDEPIHGRYILLNPTVGTVGTPGLGSYSATRYGMEAIVESLATEAEEFGVSFTSVYLDKLEPIPTNEPLPEMMASARNAALIHEIQKHPVPILVDEVTNLPTSISTLIPFIPLPSSALSAHYTSPSAPASHPTRLVEWATSQYQRRTLQSDPSAPMPAPAPARAPAPSSTAGSSTWTHHTLSSPNTGQSVHQLQHQLHQHQLQFQQQHQPPGTGHFSPESYQSEVSQPAADYAFDRLHSFVTVPPPMPGPATHHLHHSAKSDTPSPPGLLGQVGPAEYGPDGRLLRQQQQQQQQQPHNHTQQNQQQNQQQQPPPPWSQISSYVCADVIWRLGRAGAPPLRFPIGPGAAEVLREKIKIGVEEIEDWKFLHFPE